MTIETISNYYVLKSDKDLTVDGFIKSKTGSWGIIKNKDSKKLIKQLFPESVFLKSNSPITTTTTWEELCKLNIGDNNE